MSTEINIEKQIAKVEAMIAVQEAANALTLAQETLRLIEFEENQEIYAAKVDSLKTALEELKNSKPVVPKEPEL